MSNTFEFAERLGFEPPISFSEENIIPNEFMFGFVKYKELLSFIKADKGVFDIRRYLVSPMVSLGSKNGFKKYIEGDNSKNIKPSWYLSKSTQNALVIDGKSFYYDCFLSTKEEEIDKNKVEYNFNINLEKNTYRYRVLFPYKRGKSNNPLHEKYAIIIESKNYDDFLILLQEIGLSPPEPFKNEIISLFKNGIKKISDGEKLKELYLSAPLFAIEQVDKNKLFQDFMVLTKYDDTGWLSDFKDASSSLIKVLQGIRDAEFIYKKFTDNQELVKRVYYNLDGTTIIGDFEIQNKTMFVSILSGICNEVGIKDAGKLNYSKLNFVRDSNNKIDTNILKTRRDKVFLKQQNISTRTIKADADPDPKYRLEYDKEITDITDSDKGHYIKPLDMVSYRMEGQERPVAFPAIFVVDIAFHEEWEEVNKIIRVGIDVLVIIGSVISIATGPGALLMAISLVDLGLAAGDLFVLSVEEELKKTEEGKTFLRLWNTVYIVGGVITGGPLILVSGAKLLRTASLQTRNFLLVAMTRVILEIKISNFTGNTIKIINYAETVKIGNIALTGLRETTRLQKAGVIFVKGINEVDKVEGLTVIYKGAVIAEGGAKTVRETLKDIFKITDDSKLITALDRIFENLYTFNGFKFSKLSSPVSIPNEARVFPKIKANGYTQVEFRWSKDGYKFSVRAHTEIPNSPGVGQGNVWVISRKIISDGTFQPFEEILTTDKWITRSRWQEAIDRQALGNTTYKDKYILKNGHFKVR